MKHLSPSLIEQLKTMISEFGIAPNYMPSYPDSLDALEALRVFHKKEMRAEFLGIHALNPGVLHNSPSRSVMMTQHLPQHLVISGSEPPQIQTGLEYRLGEFTFSTRMPHDGTICRIVPRYSRSVGSEGIRETPEQSIIYQKESNGEYDVINVKAWESFHQYFGFENKLTPVFQTLRERMRIGKGTKFADTPANTEDECYTFGVNLNNCSMDIPGVAEDGVIPSRSSLKKMRVKLYETREISFGRNGFPLYLYGTAENPQIFPEIGEEVRHDGLLMGVRPYRDFMSAVLMGPTELQTVDHTFDEKLYTRTTDIAKDQSAEILRSKIKDIKVVKNHDTNRVLPPTMGKQLEKYSNLYHKYFKDLLAFETEAIINQRRRDKTVQPLFTPALTRMLTDARAITGQSASRFQGPVGLQYRRTPLDEYTVTFTIEHELEPREGWKLTDLNGNKGVIVQIWEDEWMPVDKAGNRADIITSSNSTVARSNWGRSFVPYFAAAARDVRKRLLAIPGVPSVPTEEAVGLMDDSSFGMVYNMLLEFYAIVSPKQYYWYKYRVTDKAKQVLHVAKCLMDKIYVNMPVDNPINDIDAVLQLEQFFPQTYSTVNYRGIGDIWVDTVDKVRIAPTYFMVLEKIADDGSSANIGKLQHHGLLASQTKLEKYGQNYRPNHTRNFGEAEMRLTVFYARSVVAAAEIHDRNNNPDTMHHMAYTLLRHPTPTNIDVIVDRKLIPYGGTRPLQYLQHFMQANGARIAYISEREAFDLGMKERFDVK